MAPRRRKDERWAQHVDEITQGVGEVARGVGAALGEVGEAMGELAGSLAANRPTPAQRLLREARRRRRQWRRHVRAYAVVVPGMALLNLLMAFEPDVLPFAALLAVGWGMGLALHGLAWRSWNKEHGPAVERARLEVEGAGADVDATLPESLAGDPQWRALVLQTRADVAATQVLLADRPHGLDASGLREQLHAGLASLESLARGAAGLGHALSAVAPAGVDGISAQIANLEGRMAATDDEALRQVQQDNLALLRARLKRVETLLTEGERMKARAEGFSLAVQNIRLDASRLAAGSVLDTDLSDPLAHLSEEVELLRQVEAELADL